MNIGMQWCWVEFVRTTMLESGRGGEGVDSRTLAPVSRSAYLASRNERGVGPSRVRDLGDSG